MKGQLNPLISWCLYLRMSELHSLRWTDERTTYPLISWCFNLYFTLEKHNHSWVHKFLLFLHFLFHFKLLKHQLLWHFCSSCARSIILIPWINIKISDNSLCSNLSPTVRELMKPDCRWQYKILPTKDSFCNLAFNLNAI